MEEQTVAQINGRPVLQPNCNRLERRNSLKKTAPSPMAFLSPNTPRVKLSPSPPISPKPKSPVDRNDPMGIQKVSSPASADKSIKRPVKATGNGSIEAPGSIAAARRVEVANLQVLRKMRIAHYGRRTNKSANSEIKVAPETVEFLALATPSITARRVKRCNFVTPNSDPIYVAYHDEEWGVPVHDDKLLFELLVLTAVQVGSDWTSVLKRREHLRNAFSGFDAAVVAKFSERRITSTTSDYGIELNQVRGAVENAKQIIKIIEEYGSFDKYVWRFVNFKPISTQYKTCQKIPVRTSKSEAMSKDLVKRGFRFVGPAVTHSFMQAAGLTNDHLISCPRRLQCMPLAHNL